MGRGAFGDVSPDGHHRVLVSVTEKPGCSERVAGKWGELSSPSPGGRPRTSHRDSPSASVS